MRVSHRDKRAYLALKQLADDLLDLYGANTAEAARPALAKLRKFHWGGSVIGDARKYVSPEFRQLLDDMIKHFDRCLEGAGERSFTREVSPSGTVIIRGSCKDGETLGLVAGTRADRVLDTATCRGGQVTLRTHINADGYRNPLQVRIGGRLYPVK